ncbi:MAG: hypothetical protein K2P81_15860 [Bacteriovoracaceae bacterium]|nr:hypothetical protein [Bacteriovoracaceae bacterium]
MLNFFRSKSNENESQLNTETREVLQDMLNKIDLRFNELSAQVREVELCVKDLEVKLLTKDLKDRQQYGALHYKLHERANPKAEREIEGVELELSLKKRLARDQ